MVTRFKSAVRFAAAALFAVMLAACASEPTLGPDDRPTHRGIFIDKNASDTSGSVGVYRSPSRVLVVLEDNFRTADQSAPRLGFGSDGFREDLVFTPIRRSRGQQVFLVPPGLDPHHYNEIWLWSDARRQPIGIARLVNATGI